MVEKDIKKEISEFKKLFEPYFEDLLTEFTEVVKSDKKPESFAIVVDQIKRLCMLSGAKRLRPFLVYLGYALCSDITTATLEQRESIMQAGAGLEIFHTSALVYDDIIDKSDMRRGEPTIEAFYKAKFLAEGQGNYLHSATSATILAGIMSHSLADRQINRIVNQRVRAFYYEMQYELIGGQVDDTFGVGASDLDTLESDAIIDMMTAKSGNYSIQKPLLLGLLLAGCPPESDLYKSIEALGYKAGILFQLVDDIIGLYESTDAIGKSNTTDILEGKRTLLIARLYQVSDPKNRIRIKSILGNPEASLEEITWIKDQIKSSGTLDYYKQYARGLAEQCVAIVKKFRSSDNIDECEVLISLINYLLIRTK